ncbi:MAG: hypothetical protein HY901_22565 [Deltaproteobacteria bacterium]|nr:hypothetical protein [Deltaproteobacteria bacterium]
MPPLPERSQDLQADDDLTADFRPRKRGGFSLALTFLGLVLAAFLLFDLRDDVSYWVARSQPVDLGASGAYRFDRVADNVLATIQGSPGPVASRFKHLDRRFEIVAFRGTPVLVRRELRGPEPSSSPGRPSPPPDQTPFIATGRLLKDTSIFEYSEAFRTLVERGEAAPLDEHLWVLLDGEKPLTGWRTPALLLALLGLLGLNAFALTRFFRRKAHAEKLHE